MLLLSSWPGVFCHLDCMGFWGAADGAAKGIVPRVSPPATASANLWPVGHPSAGAILQSLPFSSFLFNSVLTSSLAVMDFVQLRR